MSELDAIIEVLAELAMITNIVGACALGLRNRIGLAWVVLGEAIAWGAVVMLLWSARP